MGILPWKSYGWKGKVKRASSKLIHIYIITVLCTVKSFIIVSSFKDVPIPYIKLVISLVSFTFPLLVGIGIKYKWTKLAEKLKRASRPFFLLCLIFMPSMGLYQNRHFFYLCSWRHVTAGAGLGFVGYFLGALLAFICRQTRPQVTIYLKQIIKKDQICHLDYCNFS